jgi:hypothetical protein
MASLSTILSWFKTGLKPTENQFAQSWSSFWHKDDLIPQSSINGLQSILNNVTGTIQQPDTIIFNNSGIYIIPAGKMLTLLVVECTTSQVLNIGTGEGLTDLLESEQIAEGKPYAIRLDIIAERANSRTIYLSGFTGGLTINFHKQNFYKQ